MQEGHQCSKTHLVAHSVSLQRLKFIQKVKLLLLSCTHNGVAHIHCICSTASHKQASTSSLHRWSCTHTLYMQHSTTQAGQQAGSKLTCTSASSSCPFHQLHPPRREHELLSSCTQGDGGFRLQQWQQHHTLWVASGLPCVQTLRQHVSSLSTLVSYP